LRKKEAIMASRVVLLTGAAGGIGRVMTQALLADGHKVVAVDRNVESLDRLKSLCQSNERLHCLVAQLEL
jgi:NAD(P)-dependent dehydrogenase (short-subunit alcohol dehydrogenase family)